MSHPFDQMGDVRKWAPPGWHWEVSPVGARSLVRNLGPVVDPDLLWWRSRGPGAVWREARPPRRWYVDVLERRTSTSVATCICWIGLQIGVGRFFRDLTLAMIPLAFHIFGLFPSVAQHQVDVDNLLLYWWIICYCTATFHS
jgi:hypothetical protein